MKTSPRQLKKIIIALIVVVALVGLFFAVRILVSSVDIVELLKRIHGA